MSADFDGESEDMEIGTEEPLPETNAANCPSLVSVLKPMLLSLPDAKDEPDSVTILSGGVGSSGGVGGVTTSSAAKFLSCINYREDQPAKHGTEGLASTDPANFAVVVCDCSLLSSTVFRDNCITRVFSGLTAGTCTRLGQKAISFMKQEEDIQDLPCSREVCQSGMSLSEEECETTVIRDAPDRQRLAFRRNQ